MQSLGKVRGFVVMVIGRDPVQFFRFLKGLCHGNQICVVSKTQTTCNFCNFTPYESLLGADYRSEIFFNISRDVAMATNLVAKTGQNYHPMHLSLCQSKTEWDIALRIRTFIAPLIAIHRVKKW